MNFRNDYYLKIGKASDLKNLKERRIYRCFEILPGALSWITLFLAVFLSWKKPVWISIFIICYTTFWFLRIVYYSICLKISYQKMRKNEKIDWLKKLEGLPTNKKKHLDNIFHLITLPMYKEPIEIVRETFQALVNTDYPKNKIIVALGIEEKAGDEGKKIGDLIKKEFGNKFFKFLSIIHPSNLPNEIPGKGSNETFIARKAKELIIDPLKIPYENVIISVFDVDTVVFSKYFSCLTYYYLTSENPTKTSFQPISLFINNIWQAPAISRLFAFSATFWQSLNQERPEKLITFSSHAMSFKALVDVDFKQTNMVSEDSRIFWQCFLKNNGKYRVQPIFFPISMDANVGRNLWETIIKIYKQQRRWAWGVENIPYVLFGFIKNKKISLFKKISFTFELIEGHLSWATVSILIFSLGWLPILLGGKIFGQTLLSYNLPKTISQIMTISMIGLIFSIYFSILMLPPKPVQYGKFKYLILILEWFLIPFIMIFNSLPALDAQTRLMFGKYMGFWHTEKIRNKEMND